MCRKRWDVLGCHDGAVLGCAGMSRKCRDVLGCLERAVLGCVLSAGMLYSYSVGLSLLVEIICILVSTSLKPLLFIPIINEDRFDYLQTVIYCLLFVECKSFAGCIVKHARVILTQCV